MKHKDAMSPQMIHKYEISYIDKTKNTEPKGSKTSYNLSLVTMSSSSEHPSDYFSGYKYESDSASYFTDIKFHEDKNKEMAGIKYSYVSSCYARTIEDRSVSASEMLRFTRYELDKKADIGWTSAPNLSMRLSFIQPFITSAVEFDENRSPSVLTNEDLGLINQKFAEWNHGSHDQLLDQVSDGSSEISRKRNPGADADDDKSMLTNITLSHFKRQYFGRGLSKMRQDKYYYGRKNTSILEKRKIATKLKILKRVQKICSC